VLLAAAVTVGLAVQGAAAAGEGAPAIAARPSVASIRVGLTLHVTGTVTPPDATSTVIVQRAVDKAWSDRASGPVASNGTFSIPITPSDAGTYSLRVRSSGGSFASPRFTLAVTPVPTISVAVSHSAVAIGSPVTLAGTIRPANATPRVVSQRLVAGRWVDRDWASVDARTGAYGLVIHPGELTTYTMRVRSDQGSVLSGAVRVTTFLKAVDGVDLGVARPGEKVVSLTFDDGPGPSTAAVLDVLARHKVQATFFVLGEQAARQRDLVRRAVREGHHVASHSWNHPTLTQLSNGEIRSQLARTQEQLLAAGAAPRCVRPPYGSTNARVEAVVSEFRSSATVLWNVDPSDWERPGANAIVSRVMGALRPGAVVLLHDGGNRPQTVAALDALIPRIKAAGYSIRPIC
jgi:peptidoglycan/xylan/chitin deacetylase (PgdA/CDA1 family)